MVGVSQPARTSRSAWVKGRSAIVVSSLCDDAANILARPRHPRQDAPMTTIATGGKVLYGAPLGILMLEACFPRIPGDMGNATTWPFPVLYRVVKGASPERVVLQGAAGLLDAFLEAADELVSVGAEALTTNCGFLALFQKELAARVG